MDKGCCLHLGWVGTGCLDLGGEGSSGLVLSHIARASESGRCYLAIANLLCVADRMEKDLECAMILWAVETLQNLAYT